MKNQDRLPTDVAWRGILVGLVTAAIVAVAVVGGIGALAGFDELRRTFREGDHAWLLAALAMEVLVFGGYAAVYRGAVAFEGGPRIGYGLALRVVLAAFALTQTFAAAGAAGIALHYWAMRRLGFERQQAAVRVIGFNTIVYLVFGAVGLAAALLTLVSGSASMALSLPWLVTIPVLLAAAAWFTAPRRVERWASPHGGWLRRGLAIGVGAAWWVRRSLASREGRPMLVGAAVYWLGTAAALWAALHAFGADIGVAPFLLAFATGYAAQLVPLPLVATGGTDAATTFALTAVGVPLEVALLGVASSRVVSFWLPLWPALVLVALLPSTGRKLARAARPVATVSDTRVAT